MIKQFKQEQMINDGFRNFREEESTVFGQPASSKMLLSHLLILSLVCVTINGQVRGTFKCSRNPDAGETTPKADAPTTNIGATTTKAGTTTTKAGTTTTKAGATTPKADAPTTNAEATTTNVGATTTKVGATTTKAGATTTKADAPSTNFGATTTKTGTTTTKARAATTKAEATTPKADAPTTNVGATTTKTGTTTTKTGATTPKADAPTTNVGATTPKAGTTTNKADAPTTNVGATTNKAGATSTKAEATTPTADVPTTNVAATTIKAGATTNKAGATTTKAEATTTNGACSNTSIIDGSLTDCTSIYTAGCKESGIYNITPNGWTEDPFEAYCDMDIVTDPNLNPCTGRGWTVFQRRVNGSVDFNRNWTSYKEGFGQLDQEFWLGNEKLHYLAKEDCKQRLRIDLVSSSGTTYYACYREFHIKEEGEQYELHVSRFSSTNSLEDGLEHEEFSTYDKDNDKSGGQNCANIKQGGWWYKKCRSFHTNLNGVYGSNQDSTSIYWKGLPGEESIMSSEMKIRHYINCT